jgi:hypothetical protein
MTKLTQRETVLTKIASRKRVYFRFWIRVVWLLFVAELSAYCQTLCATASVQLSQNATLDRQAFVATMTIADGLPATLTDLAVTVNFTDANGNPVTDSINNPSLSNPLFFITLNNGSTIPGSVANGTPATISWLIIPTIGAGVAASGTTYNVGATVSYDLNGQPQTIVVTPAPILVEPLPSLILDYFLPTQVYGLNPQTQQGTSIPFSFGLRVTNTGVGAANNFSINAGQPQITANAQGLAETVTLLGSEVNGVTQASPTYLANFGNIPGSGGVASAAWILTSSLSGQFTAFNASFTHSSALGGASTSVIPTVNTHLFIQQVLIDTPGADNIGDFLASDTTNTVTTYTVYSSDGSNPTATYITSPQAALTSKGLGSIAGSQVYTLAVPATSGFIYVSLTDPQAGAMSLNSVVRADGKIMNPSNVWLSSSFNKTTNVWNYFFNVFDDTNNTGMGYTATYTPIAGKPTLVPIANQTIRVGATLNLTVKATDPNGPIPVLSVQGLPAALPSVGPTFTDNHNGTGTLVWTPTTGQIGSYTPTFGATANGVTATQTPTFTVTSESALQAWKDKYFPGITDPNIVGNQANPAHDGLTNLVKYALNLDPTVPEASDGVVIGTVVVNGLHYMTLTYTHRTDDPTLSFAVIASGTSNVPDSQWTPVTQTIPVDQSQVPSGMETDEVQDSIAIENGPARRFLKLQVNISGD